MMPTKHACKQVRTLASTASSTPEPLPATSHGGKRYITSERAAARSAYCLEKQLPRSRPGPREDEHQALVTRGVAGSIIAWDLAPRAPREARSVTEQPAHLPQRRQGKVYNCLTLTHTLPMSYLDRRVIFLNSLYLTLPYLTLPYLAPDGWTQRIIHRCRLSQKAELN